MDCMDFNETPQVVAVGCFHRFLAAVLRNRTQVVDGENTAAPF